MCGIAGKISFRPDKRITESEIHAMNERIKHRGPDDEGIYINERKNVGLGHRRLSIIDLSPAGHQPMCNEDGTVWIVFNGEIYNFQSLRPDLEKRGHTFKSQTDSEVIIHLWEEYGEDCVQYLRGMFAFAIWDGKARKLFLARDRSGQKPLKYYIHDDFIVFASELKAFLDDPDVPRDIDYEAIHQYLTFQYVPSPLTGFQGIKKLPPAHYLTIDLSSDTPRIGQPVRYWSLDYTNKLRLSEPEWCERILTSLDESVRLRMISDVPLGAFLSGGIDSSTIVALMAGHSEQPIKTFSIGFDEATHDELDHAKRVAERYGTDHHEFKVRPPEVLQLLPQLVYQYDEPYADSSALPTFLVSQLTREHVTVALNGDGGDENFAGYSRYTVHRFAVRYQMMLKLFRDAAAIGTRHLVRAFPNTFFDRCARFASRMNEPYERLYLEYISYFNREQKSQLYSPAMRARTKDYKTCADMLESHFNATGATHPIDRVLATDIRTYLPDDLLVKVDIATMSVGLEGRSPFLDHEFMQIAAHIPASLKMKGKEKKYILKKTVEPLLPMENIYRKKMGFATPKEYWFRNELKSFIYDTLLSEKAINRGLFDKKAVEELLNRHQNTQINCSDQIWALLTLELWFQSFFD